MKLIWTRIYEADKRLPGKWKILNQFLLENKIWNYQAELAYRWTRPYGSCKEQYRL